MPLILAVVSAFMWGTAPLIMRGSTAPTSLMPVLLGIGSVLAVLPFTPFQQLRVAGGSGIMFGLLAGVANGIGIITFYKLVGGSQQGLWQLSTISPITYALIPIFLGFGAWIFFHEGFTANKMIGTGLAVVAIWFLNK